MIKAKPAPLKILTASAGSGKTFALTVHYLALLIRNPHSYREILALTFTNKATAEMKSRILSVLETLAAASNQRHFHSAYLEEISRHFPNLPPEEIFQRADLAYRLILHDYSRFSVTTIDGFSQQVIRSFTYELGIDSTFRLELNMEAVRKDLMTRLYKKLNHDKSLLQWIIQQILDRVDEGKSWNVNRQLYALSGIIFSDDFKQFEETLSQQDSDEVFELIAAFNKAWIQDFSQKVESWVNSIEKIRLRNDVIEHDLYRKSANGLLKMPGCCEKKDFAKLFEYSQKFADNIDAFQSAKSRAPGVDMFYEQSNADLVALRDYLEENLPSYFLILAVDGNIRHLRLLKSMAGSLADWRSANNAQLISDAQTLLQRIGLTEHGDPTFIWEKIGNRYTYFLFDEFQDTSQTQWSNLFPLLANALSGRESDLHEHLIVGDVKQSIYRWRNGDFRILLQGIESDIQRTFHTAQTSEFIDKASLTYNYRSEAQIVQFSNYLVSTIPSLLQNQLNECLQNDTVTDETRRYWLENQFDRALIQAYQGGEQQIPANRNPVGGELYVEFLSGEEEEKGITVGEFKDTASERCFIQIETWLQTGRYEAGDIGILVRTNEEARNLVAFLKKRQMESAISFPILSGDALMVGGHPVIRSLTHLLRFLCHENVSYNHDLAMALFFYKEDKGEILSADDWLLAGAADIFALRTLLPEALLDAWPRLKFLPLGELIERMIRLCGWTEHPSAVPYLLAFRDWVGQAVHSGIGGLERLLHAWEEEQERLTLPAEQGTDAVEILTIHKAKGLDFDAVIIPFCQWNLDGHRESLVWADLQGTPFEKLGKIPLKYTSISQSSVQAQYYEELLYFHMDALNNFYVAATRARSALCIYAPAVPEKNKDKVPKTVGEVLAAVLEASTFSRLEEPASGYVIHDRADSRAAIAPEAAPAGALTLSSYPVASAAVLVKSLPEPGARLSNLLHELMAKAKDLPEALQQLKYAQTTLLLEASEFSTLEAYLRQVWSQTELNPLLLWPDQANELALVDLDGKTWRPDKVFFLPEKTIVLDFKLTAEINVPAHSQQVQKYMALLRALKYREVMGYVYYFKQDQLLEIKA